MSFEYRNGALGLRYTEAAAQQRLACDLETRWKRFAPDRLDAEVAQAKIVDPVARPCEYRQCRKICANERGSLYRSLDVVDRQHEQIRFARLCGV